MKAIGKICFALSAAGLFCASVNAAQAEAWDGSKPAPGIYFNWYEPSFYAGFAPRSQNPDRFHVELSRGNQVRLTMVLGGDEMDSYLEDLVYRRDTYQKLIDQGTLKPSVNNNYQRFADKIDEMKLAEVVAGRGSMEKTAYWTKTAELMKELNPGAIFYIHMPLDKVLADWHGVLAATPEEALGKKETQLDLANAVLPGRVNAYALTAEQVDALTAIAAEARTKGADDPTFVEQAKNFLTSVTKGYYTLRDGYVDAIEFTRIMPAGTVKAYVNTKHGKLPGFGVTGVWGLMERAQGRGITGMVDYLSSNPGYGFIPLLAYQHAGGVYYNAFHNAGIRSPVGTRYLPKSWRSVSSERNPKHKYKNLWLVSRGPASHGCTRLDSGQMSEMRHMMPSDQKSMVGMATYRNLPQCYDVFDIDGNGTPEVMGVQYYVAYVSKGHKPVKPWAPNTRKPYYNWLYGENISFNDDGSAVIKNVPVCRFVGKKKAAEANVLQDIPLYEAPFEPGPIQFYTIKSVSFESRAGMEFNRELRRIGSTYDANKKKLMIK
ncbi:MAG: hypothetical protein ACR2OJ_03215 [Hyphomicrobiales bacterium]